MRIGRHFCTTGLLFGTLFFAFSLTPSLVPRGDTVQGVISGLSLAAGYGAGVFARWLWFWLELPVPRQQWYRLIQLSAAGLCGLLALVFLWRSSQWQNDLRVLMDMDSTDGTGTLLVGLVALLLFVTVLLLARLFRHTWLFLSRRMQRFIPAHISHAAGLVLAFALFWSVVEGVLYAAALRSADSTYQQIDAMMEPDLAQPADPMRAGSPASLLQWQHMGRHGRRFLSMVPDNDDIAAFSNGPVPDPIRVYVGLNQAETAQERARLALEELKRLGGFERGLLVLVTPTGTGWVERRSITPLEYLHRGDIATVAAQYSYLPSALSLMSESDYGVEMAQAMFEAIYGHWTGLPEDQRPKLYLHGLSLGALNSDRSFDFYDIIDDPFQGALWSGPPFRSDTWRSVTARRRPDSPAWLPRFRDDSVVRFANQNGGLDVGESTWGSFRIAFLQYASDPVTFFDPRALYREPAWMQPPRGPDVSNNLRWFPVVTMLQLAADIIAGAAPRGYGHEFAADHYLDAWYALTEPEGWDADDLARLREVVLTIE